MSSTSRSYENFLDFLKQHNILIWVSRQLNPQLAYKQGVPRPSPKSHKENVLDSPRLQEYLNNISKKQNVSKLQLEEQVKAILDEIGYSKNLKVIRWLGLILTKICLRVSTGIHVNANHLLHLKRQMGNCPVIFVPSHRSYADFILMSLVCFVYDIEIPAIAAGMDFHGMWGMGSMLRDTGAFFMRRTYNKDDLYWTTFKQYIYQLVTKGDLPIEFFIEGTRSRSNKSLVPKYGLISMILKALFFAEVPDIKFVPINISYDRILEETLFAFELLGVPKPKESTSGFFKSLRIVTESFGKIYFHFGEPISAKTYFGDKLNRSEHNRGPLHLQEITEKEKALIPPLAHDIIYAQQKCSVITVFNLVSLVLNHNLVTSKVLLTVEELNEEVLRMKDVVEKLGAFVFTENIQQSIDECLTVHKNLIELRTDNRIGLVQNNIVLDKLDPSKLKAHSLSEECMTFSLPFVMLQMYINPSLHYFVDASLVVIILKYYNSLDKEELFNAYHFLRSLFSVEFVTFLPWLKMVGFSFTVFIEGIRSKRVKEFEKCLQYSAELNLISCTSGDLYELGRDSGLQSFLCILFQPFLMSYFVTVVVLERCPEIIDEKTILANTQKILESKINHAKEFVHPYSLNLDSITNCLNVLSSLGILNKVRRDNKVIYDIGRDEILHLKERLGKYVPDSQIEDIFIAQSFIQNKL